MAILAPTRDNIERAATVLERGGLVAFPTETVYGLAADAFDSDALTRLFAAKGRPQNHPVIVHVDATSGLERLVSEIPAEARALAALFWPGPLTLVLERSTQVPAAVTGGQETVGVRMPRHPVASQLLRAFGGPLAAPSANRFGRVSPTTANHVLEELGERAAMVLDGGPSEVGLESTILDLSGGEAVLLRPGAVTEDDIHKVLGRRPARPGVSSPRSPGRLASHYAPRTPTRLVPRGGHARAVPSGDLRLGVLSLGSEPISFRGLWKQLPARPEAAGKCLYAALRDLDNGGLDLIVVEEVPLTPSWAAVYDRIAKATAAGRQQGEGP